MGLESPEKPKPEPSALADFGNSLLNSAVQNPLNSLSQIASAITGEKLPEMHYFDPAQATTGTAKFAEQAGNVIGMAVPFLISRKAVGLAEAKMGIVASGTALSIAAEQAAIGGFMGLALTPSDQGFVGRFKNGIVDAGTFGVMGAASAKLQSSFAFTGELPLSSRIMKSSLIGLTSGAGGGLANAELNAVVNKGEAVASFEDFRNDALSFAALGGIFGVVDGLHTGKTAAKAGDGVPAYPAEPVASGRSTTAEGAVVSDAQPVAKGAEQAETLVKKPETVDPRPAADGHFERLATEWGVLTPLDLQGSNLLVQHDLADFKVVSPEGKPESVLDVWGKAQARFTQGWTAQPKLGEATDHLVPFALGRESLLQAQAKLGEATDVWGPVMKANALIREHFASLTDNGHILADQAAGWTHTMGEQARVLQAAEASHLTPEQTKLALLASAYSDAAKYSETGVTTSNFQWHHLDGAISATLPDLGLSPDEVNLVTSAIKAHQIAPPEFMAKLYYMRANGLKNLLGAPDSPSVLPAGSELRLELDRRFTPEEQARLKGILDPATSSYIGKSKDGMPTFKFIADAMTREAEPTADGDFALKLNSDEQLLLRLSGLQNIHQNGKPTLIENLDKWYVPHDATTDPGFGKLPAAEQQRLVDLNKITKALLAGDNAQYATIDGAYKYVQIRGPGTYFKDGTVFDSIASIRDSYDDAYTILDPTARRLNDLHLAQTSSAYEPGGQIRNQLDAAIQKEFGTTDVAFYGKKLNADEYPKVSPADQATLNQLAAKLDNKSLTAGQRTEIYTEAQTLSGLNEQASHDYIDAIRVKNISARVMREAASMDPANVSDDFVAARSGNWRTTLPGGLVAQRDGNTLRITKPDGSSELQTYNSDGSLASRVNSP